MDALQNAVRELTAVYDDYFKLSAVLQEDGNRVLDDPRSDQAWRRTLLRTTWPMVEAYSHCIRRICEVLVRHTGAELKDGERKLLYNEERLGAPERVKKTLKLAYRIHELSNRPNFGEQGWENACTAITERDRLMHPKHPADLEIDDSEWETIHNGLAWMLRVHTAFFDRIYQKFGP